MNIKIAKFGKKYYCADCIDLPGSPPLGFGESKELALAALFYLMMWDSTCGPCPTNWLKYIVKGNPIIINGKQWKYPFKK